MEEQPTRHTVRWPVYLALILLGVVSLVFLVEFVSTSQRPITPTPEGLTPDTYMDKVNALLMDANPDNGDKLIDHYECATCHRAGAANGIAPSFVGIAERAASRRPPLTAAAYIYESITQPDAYTVEGYSQIMLKNYAERLSDRELGDIIAYLISGKAK